MPDPSTDQPVTLDMSTAQPIPPPPSGTAVPVDPPPPPSGTAIPLAPDGTAAIPNAPDGTPAVKLDMTTAKPITLAQRIKAKYPEYADMDDATLEDKVLAKHPEYSDLPRTARASTPSGIADPKKAVAKQMDDDNNRSALAGVPGGSENVQPASNTALGGASTAIGAAAASTGASEALPFISGGVKAVSAWATKNPVQAYLVYKTLEAAIPGFKKMVGVGKSLGGE